MALIKKEYGERGVRARNQDGDVGMIDSAPDLLGLGLPADPVIEGAACEKGHRSEGKDAQGDPAAQFIGQSDQNQAGDQRNWAHNEVNQAAQARFLGLFGAIEERSHLTSLRVYPEKGGSACRQSPWGGQVYKGSVLTLWAHARYLSPLLL